MDFAIRHLSVLAYAQGFTLWHYKAVKGCTGHVAAPGFFNPAADMLATGDMMLISASDGGCVRFITNASDAQGVITSALG